MNHGRKQITRRYVSAVVLASALAFAAATPAQAVGTETTLSFSPATVSPGNTFDLTLTPGATALRDFCLSSVYGPGSTQNTDPGFSVHIDVTDGASFSYKIGTQPDGSGVGSFTPSTQTSPLTLTFTLPADVPDGTYSLYVWCIGPESQHYPWNSPGVTVLLPGFTVSSAAPPTDPESSGSESSTTRELANTGLSDTSLIVSSIGATLLLAAGVCLVVTRRRHA